MAEPLGLLDIFSPQEDNGLLDPRRAAAAGLFAGLTNFGAQLAAAGAPRVGQPGPGWGGGLAAAGPAFSQAYSQGRQQYVQEQKQSQDMARDARISRVMNASSADQLSDPNEQALFTALGPNRGLLSLTDQAGRNSAITAILSKSNDPWANYRLNESGAWTMTPQGPQLVQQAPLSPNQRWQNIPGLGFVDVTTLPNYTGPQPAATPSAPQGASAPPPAAPGSARATTLAQANSGGDPTNPGVTTPQQQAAARAVIEETARLRAEALNIPDQAQQQRRLQEIGAWSQAATAAALAGRPPMGAPSINPTTGERQPAAAPGTARPQPMPPATTVAPPSPAAGPAGGPRVLVPAPLTQSTIVRNGVPTVVATDSYGNVVREIGPAANSAQDPNWQEWNRLNALGNRRTEAQQRQFEALDQALTRSRPTSEPAYDSERGKTLAQEENAIRNAGTRASATLMRIGVIERALNGGFTTGAGSETAITAGQLAQRLGIPDSVLGAVGLRSDQTASGEQIRAMASTLITGMLGAGGFPSQNFSNADREMLERSLPSLQNSVEGNRALAGIMRAMAERDRDISQAWNTYRRQHGSGIAAFDRFSTEVLPELVGRDVLAPIISQAFPNGVPQAAAPAPTARPQAVVPGPNGGAASPPPNIPAPPQGFRIVR